MEEEVKQEETLEDEGPNLSSVLAAFNNSPSEEMINSWKKQFGDVFCSGFSDTELFVWRPLNRKEYIEMQMASSQSETVISQYEMEEHLVRQCILWSSDDGRMSLTQKAGSLSTLQEQILQNSNFVAPQVAARLVFKL